MTQAIAYLNFDGNTADVMRFYERALGGKLEMLLRGGDSPMAAEMPKEYHDRIIHACLVLPGGGMIYAGDCPMNMAYEGIKGVSLTVDYPTVDEARKVFAALTEGGQVTMPMQAAFWAKLWGMGVDKYGTAWIVNGEPIPYLPKTPA